MKNNKGFASIAIVLVIIAILAVGGVVYYTSKSPKTEPVNVEENNLLQESQNVDQNVSAVDNQLKGNTNDLVAKKNDCEVNGLTTYDDSQYKFLICYKYNVNPYKVEQGKGTAFMNDQTYLDTIFVGDLSTLNPYNDSKIIFLNSVTFGNVSYDKFEEKNFNQKSYKYTYYYTKIPNSNFGLLIDVVNPNQPSQSRFLDLSTLYFY